MTLVRTGVLNGTATAVRIAAAIVLNKVLAVYVGPSGYAVFGQFSNIAGLAGSASGGALGAGVTKYTAEHVADLPSQRAYWRAAAQCVGLGSFFTALLLLLLHRPLAHHMLGDERFGIALVALALCLPLAGFNGLLVAILTGKKALRLYVLQNIASSVVLTGLCCTFAAQWGLTGALMGAALAQAALVLPTLWLCRSQSWLRLSSFAGAADNARIRSLLGFSLMALTSALVVPLGQMLVRSSIAAHLGEAAAGEWQAVFKISEIYLMVFTSTLSVYYLPRLAEIRKPDELWSEIRSTYKLLLPVCVAAAAIMYLLRDWIVRTLFTEAFIGMTALFAWQLFGDVLKIGSWVVSYVLVGKAMFRWFIVTEVIFTGTWVGLTVGFLPLMGDQAAPAAFAVNYALYWLVMGALVARTLKRPQTAERP